MLKGALAVAASGLAMSLFAASVVHATCAGDCDSDGVVGINELVTALTLALDGGALDACRPADVDGNGGISIADLIRCVGDALSDCGPSPTSTPLRGVDLRPSDVLAYGVYQSGCRLPLAYLSVCVENYGDTPSGPFAVTVQPGDDRFDVSDLAAQARLCADRPFFGWEVSGFHDFQLVVDVDGVVDEIDELNNTATVRVMRPTIPATCSPTALPTPDQTTLRSPTPTPSATAASVETATPTPIPTTFRIDGCVEHFSGCGGSLEFGTVLLSPLGRAADVDLGYLSLPAYHLGTTR